MERPGGVQKALSPKPSIFIFILQQQQEGHFLPSALSLTKNCTAILLAPLFANARLFRALVDNLLLLLFFFFFFFLYSFLVHSF
jgi:hypothetical protein